MFTSIEASGYRSLLSVNQRLSRFQALVGPNASGKSTFLDVIEFLSALVKNRSDVFDVTSARSSNFQDLLWKGVGNSFQLAVEAKIPSLVNAAMSADKRRYEYVRYEIEVGTSDAGEIGLNHETLWLKQQPTLSIHQRDIFPAESIRRNILSKSGSGLKAAITKKLGGNDNYYTEGRQSYAPSFKLGQTRSALANIPADEESFPVSTWFYKLLQAGVQQFVLSSQALRQPSPPGQRNELNPNGSNLPWIVEALRKDESSFQRWLDHIRTALDDIKDIRTVERPEDRHRYLVVEYANGAKVPSWLVSDGTLRLFALTIPAYLKNFSNIILVEEPENGIHPRAIETVLQSLSSIYSGQVLIATHSPVALNMLDSKDVLCFAKNSEGATDIVSGDIHPALRSWKEGQPTLGVLFASGVLS